MRWAGEKDWIPAADAGMADEEWERLEGRGVRQEQEVGCGLWGGWGGMGGLGLLGAAGSRLKTPGWRMRKGRG